MFDHFYKKGGNVFDTAYIYNNGKSDFYLGSWIESRDLREKEMIKTFNCGVGFCIIVKPKNLKKIKKYFSKNFQPYFIGKITNGKKNVDLNGKIKW